MPLVQEDFQVIGEYVRTQLREWLAGQRLGQSPHDYEIELRERIVRVDEELKNQRELMKQGFELMEKRFESLTRRIDHFMIWSFGLTVTMAGVIIAVLKWSCRVP